MPVLDGGSGGGGKKRKSSSDGYLSRAQPEDRSFRDQFLRSSFGRLGSVVKALDAPRAAAARLGQVDVAGKLGLPSQANYLVGPAALPRLIEEEVRPRAPEIAKQMRRLSPGVIDAVLSPEQSEAKNRAAVNLAADVVEDPLTYVTFGTGAAAKTGLRAIGKELGKEVAEDVVQRGAARALSGEARERVARSLVEAGRTPRQTERILGAVERGGQGGVKVAGRTVVPTARIPGAAKAGQAVRGSIRTGRLRTAAEAVSPRAGIAADLGTEAAEEVGSAAARARAASQLGAQNIVRRLEPIMRKAKPTRRELEDIVGPALDIGGESVEVPQRLRPLVDELAAIRREGTDRLTEADLLPRMRDPETYVPLDITARGQRALGVGEGPAIGEQFGRIPTETQAAGRQGGHLLERSIMPDAPIAQIEEQLGGALRTQGLLKGDLTIRNPVTTFGERFARAEQALARKQYIDELTQLDLPEVGRVLMKADEGVQRPAGWVEVNMGNFGKFYAPKSISEEVNRVQAVITNDRALAKLKDLYNQGHAWWKSVATVGSIIGGGGFFARNAIGNTWNNYLAGVTNPAHYSRAAKLMTKVRKGGVDSLSATDRKLYEQALEEGVVGSGFYATELTRAAQAPESLLGGGEQVVGRLGRAVKPQGAGERARRAAGTFGREGPILRAGTAVSSAVEDHARLTHFIAKMDELGDSADAARSVRKYLFDYGDLTAVDRNIKMAIPFWTWARKNTPLQVRALASTPGKFSAYAHLLLNLAAQAEPGAYPEWAVEEGMIPVGDTMVGVETPVASAVETLNPSPRNVLGLFGGPVLGPAKALAEEATGTSLFSGFGVKGSFPKRLGESAVPLAGRLERAPYTAFATGDEQAKGRLLGAAGLQARVLTGDEGPRRSAEATQAPRRGRRGGRVLPP